MSTSLRHVISVGQHYKCVWSRYGRNNRKNDVRPHDTHIHTHKPVIIWVPSHVGIEGNEIADQIANDMVNAEYIEPIETPKSIILGDIRKHFQHVWHQSLQIKANENDKRKWYLETTTLPNDTYNRLDINKRHDIGKL